MIASVKHALALPLLALCALAAGCTDPWLRPLDYDPPRELRETWSYSFSHEQRYDGHRTIRAKDGSLEEPQSAGDFQTRARTFTSEKTDLPVFTLVNVATFGTPAYYDEIGGLLRGADVVIPLIRVKGDEDDTRRIRGAAPQPQLEYLRRLVAIYPGLIACIDADGIAANASYVPVELHREDLDLVEREKLDPEIDKDEFEEALAALEKLARERGPDVALHNIICQGFVANEFQAVQQPVHLAPGQAFPDDAFDPAMFEQRRAEAEKEKDPKRRHEALAYAFNRHRMPELCLETADLCAAKGARRIVILAIDDRAWGVSDLLRARGYKPGPERWLTAIPILSRGRPAAR